MRVCADLPNYIGYTWSCKAEYNKNKPEGENCYVSGNYTAEALNEVVTKFVQEWILCPKCNNPELNMKVKAKKGGQVPFLSLPFPPYSTLPLPSFLSLSPNPQALYRGRSSSTAQPVVTVANRSQR